MIGDNFDIPIMYQDLANSTMPPLNLTAGGYYGHTSYLGGITLPRQPDKDKLDLINKKDEQTKSTAKKILAGLGAAILLGGTIVLGQKIKKKGGIGKVLSQFWNTMTGKIKNIFKKK